MSPKQLVRLRNLRAPDAPNADGLTQAEVRVMASSAETYEQYNSAVISQLRLVAGSQAWTQPPSPADNTGPTNGNGYPSHNGQEVLGEVLDGAHNGANVIYSLSHFAVPQSVKVFYNGLRLSVGASQDYIVSESVLGQGFDTVELTGAAPLRGRDRLWADYIRSA